MAWWVPLSILLEFLIGWLWSETGSVWPGAMLHAGSNMVASLGMMLVFGDTVGITGTTVLLCCARAWFRSSSRWCSPVTPADASPPIFHAWAKQPLCSSG